MKNIKAIEKMRERTACKPQNTRIDAICQAKKIANKRRRRQCEYGVTILLHLANSVNCNGDKLIARFFHGGYKKKVNASHKQFDIIRQTSSSHAVI